MSKPPTPESQKRPAMFRLKILQCDNQELYYNISSLAFQFAILGYVDVSRNLVSKLNTFNKYHGQDHVLRPLCLLWNETGEWPAGEEDRIREDIEAERKRTHKFGFDENGRPGQVPKADYREDDIGKPITQQDIQAEMQRLASDSYAQGWWWPGRPNNLLMEMNMTDEENKNPHKRELSRKETLEAIKELWGAVEKDFPPYRDATTGGAAMYASSGLVSALDLSLSLKEKGGEAEEETTVPTTAEIFEQISKRLDANKQISYLAQSQRAWKMLRDGALCRVLGIDEKKVDAFAKELEDAVDERVQGGRMILSDLPMKEILEIMDDNTVHGRGARDVYADMGVDPPKTLFADPATEEQVAEMERRLDVELPADYKEFLSLTNGFGSAFGGVLHDPPLFKCDEIRWFRDDEPYFKDAMLDIPGDLSCTLWALPKQELEAWPKVGNAIIIGSEDTDNTWLIPPSKIAEVREKVKTILQGGYPDSVKNSVEKAVKDFAGSFEEWDKLHWCCIMWGVGSMSAYPSFKTYLRSVAENGGKAKDEILAHGKFFGYALRKEEGA